MENEKFRFGDMADTIHNAYDDLDMDDYGETATISSKLKFRDIDITIDFNVDESKQHIENDYNIIEQYGLDQLVLKKFIPWLKGNDFLDKDDQEILNGLKLYEVTYTYSKIVAEYSPTKKDDYFGQFEFCFESGSDYTKDIFEANMKTIMKENNVRTSKA